MYKLLAHKVHKCLRVPEHLKEKYRKVWLPGENDELRERLYNKKFHNDGYCICTFSSRLMAQRALYNINMETSFDLSLLPLQPINLP